jgi:hypothetical protein
MKTTTALLIASSALFALAGNAFGQTTVEPGPGPEPGLGPIERVTPPPLPEEIQALIQQFREQRQEILRLRAELIARLRNCTEEERAAIVAEFRAQYRDQIRAQIELRKQIRRELMELRRERRRLRAGAG